jgi:hypothetical protein
MRDFSWPSFRFMDKFASPLSGGMQKIHKPKCAGTQISDAKT